MTYEEFFKIAATKKLNNIQVTEKTSIGSSFNLINGELEDYNDNNNINYEIKGELNKKTVSVASEYLSEEILDNLIFNIENTDSFYEDEYLEKTANIEQKEIPKFDVSNELKELKKLDSLRTKFPQITKLAISFSEEYQNTRIVNSNNVDISTDSHLCSLSVEAIAEKDGNYTCYGDVIIETDKNNINFFQFINSILENATILSNKEKLKSDKYNILLSAAVSGRILSNLQTMLSRTALRQKVSCLENKFNKKIFSDKLTVIEDPCNNKYPGYRLFDDEGTLTKKKVIIESGIIKTDLSNIKEAKLKNEESTGNAYNGIGTRNMYVLPGSKDLNSLLKKLDNGIYITDYMGSQSTSINSVTGNISLQVFGFKVENGTIASGIEPCIMTTTIFELLSNIEEIGKDLQFTKISSACPSLLINAISITR